MTGLESILDHARATGSAQFAWNGNLNWLAQDEETAAEWYITEDGGGFVSQPFATAAAAVAWLREYERGGDVFVLEGTAVETDPLRVLESI